MLSLQSNSLVIGKTSRLMCIGKNLSPMVAVSSSSHLQQRSLRYAVLGAGFAGLSVAWNLLEHSPIEFHISIDVVDEVGIGGGASGVSGGLLHPYSPKVKPLWRAAECWEESLKLIRIAETAIHTKESSSNNGEIAQSSSIARRRGILRPAVSLKNMGIMNDNAQNSLASCRIQSINEDAAKTLVPNICIPSNLAFHMPNAVNIHPQPYLEALYVACETLAKDMTSVGPGEKEINFHKKSIDNLLELEGEYDAIIVCVGARSTFLPELSGRLPLRTCRGVTAHFNLPENIREEIPEHSPSVLSDAWLAIQNPRNLHVGSTWDWKSNNYSQKVSMEEASRALEELLPKASAVYPSLTKWAFNGATAGLRAMPPLTAPKKATKEAERIDNFFASYANTSSGMIDPEGVEKLCSDLTVEHTDVRILMLAWKMNAKKQGYFTQEEWRTGLKSLRADTLKKLKKELSELEKEVAKPTNFEDFYCYSFRYCLTEDKQKSLDIESVCVLLDLVLGPNFRLQVDSFCDYLKIQKEYKVVNMDQWTNFLRFCQEIEFPALQNYDACQAWPLILDNFVEWLREKSKSA